MFNIGESIATYFTDTINGWLSGIVTSFFELFDTALSGILNNMLYSENYVTATADGTLSAANILSIYNFMYTLVCSLIALKFLAKGFQVYILWRDGDADTSPRELVTGVAYATVMMALFPTLYDYMASITIYISNSLMTLATGSGQINFMDYDLVSGIGTGKMTIFILILLVYAVLFFLLWIQLVSRGFELLILRLGFPIACLGLVDSDGGLFKGYMQTILKALWTSVIQLCLISLSIKVVMSMDLGNIIAAIALTVAALKTPTLMQQLLVSGRPGGGMASKIHTTSMLVNGVKGLVGK